MRLTTSSMEELLLSVIVGCPLPLSEMRMAITSPPGVPLSTWMSRVGGTPAFPSSKVNQTHRL